MSLEARLHCFLQDHKGERIHINHLAKRLHCRPDAIIHKLELFHWCPCGEGYFMDGST
jgi:hypothetical protein